MFRPTRVPAAAAPSGEVGALDLVEWHWESGFIEACLHELAELTGAVCFGAHPLRFHGIGRP
jgi:hypothetical protein